MSTPLDKNPEQGESLTELLRQLASTSAAVVHDEIELVKQEAREKARGLRSGVVLILLGFFLGLAGLLCFAAALIFFLIPFLGVLNATMATGAGFAALGVIVAFMGIAFLKGKG